jgi:hypothetical protein
VSHTRTGSLGPWPMEAESSLDAGPRRVRCQNSGHRQLRNSRPGKTSKSTLACPGRLGDNDRRVLECFVCDYCANDLRFRYVKSLRGRDTETMTMAQLLAEPVEPQQEVRSRY